MTTLSAPAPAPAIVNGRIQTRFGEFNLVRPEIVTFPEGIPGFEQCRRFVVILADELSPLTCLQALDEPYPSFLASAPATLRADLAFNQSRVDGQAAPSRLAGQAPLLINIGWDARPAGPLGWGATLHYEAGYASRALPTTSFNPSSGTANDPGTRVDQAAQCTLDAYALWTLAPHSRLRLRGSQLGGDWRAVSRQRQQLGEWRTHFQGSRPWAVALSLEQDW